MAKGKPIRVTVGDRVVEARRVDVERYDGWKDQNGLGHPKERSRFEVYVDDVLRGHIALGFGWGVGWQAQSLGRLERWHSEFPKTLTPYKPESKTVLQKPTKEQLLTCFAEWATSGQAPSRAEIDVWAAELKVTLAREAQEKAERAEAQLRRVDADNAARAAEKAREVETLEGLLARRHVVSLTNMEVVILERILERRRSA